MTNCALKSKWYGGNIDATMKHKKKKKKCWESALCWKLLIVISHSFISADYTHKGMLREFSVGFNILFSYVPWASRSMDISVECHTTTVEYVVEWKTSCRKEGICVMFPGIVHMRLYFAPHRRLRINLASSVSAVWDKGAKHMNLKIKCIESCVYLGHIHHENLNSFGCIHVSSYSFPNQKPFTWKMKVIFIVKICIFEEKFPTISL